MKRFEIKEPHWSTTMEKDIDSSVFHTDCHIEAIKELHERKKQWGIRGKLYQGYIWDNQTEIKITPR